MKRLNPDTGELFVQGDYRDDGYRFWGYRKSKTKGTGYFVEVWRSPLQFEIENSRIVLWHSENRDKVNAAAAKTRAKRIKRKPKWIKDVFIEEIKVWYKRARILNSFTGERWEVDHIIPLQGKMVSGLHVPWNLQLLTKSENSSKGNRHVC